MPKTPAYVAISDTLRERIATQNYVPGDKLPSERDLVEEFGVARMTVRHALDLLQEEGMIERRRGRTGGTFVRAKPPVLELTAEHGFEDHFEANRDSVTTTVTKNREVAAPLVVANEFGLPNGSMVHERQVIHSAENTPLMYATVYTRVGGAPTEGNLRRDDLLTAARASEKERDQLRLQQNAVVQRVCRRTFVGDTLAEYTLIALRPDAAQLRAVTQL